MADFDPKSRYAKLVPLVVRDHRGREVLALPIPDAPVIRIVGKHDRRQGQRIDHIAAAFTRDANGFWRIAEANGAMLPDALAEAIALDIPDASR